MPEWVDKWVKVGLSTEPANWAKAEEAARSCYRITGLAQPAVVLRLGSPFAATYGGILAVGLLGRSQVEAQVRSQVESQVRSQVELQLASQVLSQIKSQVWMQVELQIRSQVESQIRSQVESQVQSQIRSQIKSSQVWTQVESQVQWQVFSQVVRSQVESQIWSHVRSQARSQVWSRVASQYRCAQLWASWYAWVTFFRDVCGWQNPSLEAFGYDEQLALSCGWTWWHEDVCAISDRIAEIHRDNQHRLHNLSGPALRYPDGWSIYSVHGVVVPEHVIVRPDALKGPTVLNWPNAEVRRVMIEQMGYSRFLAEVKAEEIDRDPDPHWGTLYEVPSVPVRFVRMRNCTPETDGSWKDYVIAVPRECRTAREGILWSWNLKPEEFNELEKKYEFARS
jgi:uncharacterized protein DUF6745